MSSIQIEKEEARAAARRHPQSTPGQTRAITGDRQGERADMTLASLTAITEMYNSDKQPHSVRD